MPKQTPPAPAPLPPTAATPHPAPLPPPAIVNPPVTEQPSNWNLPRYLSLAAIGVGVAAIGTSLYAFHINGAGTCDPVAPKEACPKIHDTKSLGTGLLIGGSAAVVGGLTGVIYFAPRDSVNVAIGPNGYSLSFSGAF
jgi:hypothetical protein